MTFQVMLKSLVDELISDLKGDFEDLVKVNSKGSGNFTLTFTKEWVELKGSREVEGRSWKFESKCETTEFGLREFFRSLKNTYIGIWELGDSLIDNVEGVEVKREDGNFYLSVFTSIQDFRFKVNGDKVEGIE